MALKNELRLNNLINCIYHDDDDNETSCIGRVMCIDDTGLGEWVIWVDSEAKVEEYDSFEPINLTEEWHNKFGVKVNGHMSFVYELPRKQTIYLAIVFTGDYVVLRQGKDPKEFEMVSVWNKDLMKRDMFVHELQNLYFALTGEELNVINNG